MSEIIGPFDTATWSQDQWYRYAPAWAPSGVIGTPAGSSSSGGLGLTFSGLTPTLAVGRAWVRGAGYEVSGTAKTMAAVPANANATLSRRDRIVLRRDLAAKTVTPVLIQGTPLSTPVPPALTQVETGQWDIPLFSFLVPPASGSTITGIIDERIFTDGDSPPRGIVIAAEQSSPQSSSSATEARVVGATSIAANLTPGRAYRVRWSSTVGTDTVPSTISVIVRGARNATPTTGSTRVAGGNYSFNDTGGPGQSVMEFSDLFTVATADSYNISPWIARPAGSGTVSVTSSPSHLEIEDVGPSAGLSGFAQLS